jgi:CBS-domain-containing membrane protein
MEEFMRAADVMTTAVITTSPNTSVAAVAALLCATGISGVPVVDSKGRMVGIVSEGDLLHRAEIGTGRRTKRRRSWWLEVIKSGRDAGFRDYVKTHGRTVENVMTRDVISVSETTELADIATLLETKRIKRVPVVRDGQLVGIISRSNLVRALTATKRDAATKADVNDAAIRHGLLAEVARQKWNHVHAEDIVVKDGIVHLWFSSGQSREERQAIHVAAENIAGVRSVEEHVVAIPLIPGA